MSKLSDHFGAYCIFLGFISRLEYPIVGMENFRSIFAMTILEKIGFELRHHMSQGRKEQNQGYRSSLASSCLDSAIRTGVQCGESFYQTPLFLLKMATGGLV